MRTSAAMTMDVRAQAAAVVSVPELAQVLRELRERLALRRSSLSYRQIAERARISSGAVGIYLTGARLPSGERFAALVEVLGADVTGLRQASGRTTRTAPLWA